MRRHTAPTSVRVRTPALSFDLDLPLPLRLLPLALLALLSGAACSGERPTPITASKTAPPSPAGNVTTPTDYVLEDPGPRPSSTATRLDETGSFGVVVGGTRVVVKNGVVRAVADAPSSPLRAAERIPPRLGGGFLFRTDASLFRSESWNGALTPLVTLPETIAAVSFGPKAALVRGADGARWAIHLKTGARVPIDPVGLVDIKASADGRAIGITEFGRAIGSTNAGETWDDLTPRLAGSPADMVAINDDLYLSDETGRAYRLEHGGAVREFDEVPEPPPPRPADPRWHGAESPLRLAVRKGAKVDERTAVVAAGGDIVHVDVRTGSIKAVTPGRLPPDLDCEAVRAPDDVIIVCAGETGPSVVVSNVLHEDTPRIEKMFPTPGPFFANDDGAIVFGGPCSTDRTSPWTACSRGLTGEWKELSLETPRLRTERRRAPRAAAADINPSVRWIPRVDGPPLAIVSDDGVFTINPATGKRVPWKLDPATGDGPKLLEAIRPESSEGEDVRRLDRRFLATAGEALRGWVAPGHSVEISESGSIVFSAFKLDAGTMIGSMGFGGTKDGRTFQTLDHGFTWSEVAAPPAASKTSPPTPLSCSPVGCDLGLWMRIGWEPTPPSPSPEPVVASAPPSLSRPPLPEIVCAPLPGARFSSLSSDSDGAGLGASRTPVDTSLPSGEAVIYQRTIFDRGFIHPGRDSRPYGFDDFDTMPRLMVHGFGIEWIDPESDAGSPRFTVLSPTRSQESFRRVITYVEPFDPAGSIHSTSLGLDALETALRSGIIDLKDVLTSEGLDMQGFVPVLPLDAASSTDLVFTIETERSVGEILGAISRGRGALRTDDRAGSSPRGSPPHVSLAPAHFATGPLVSAVALPGGDIAVLKATDERMRLRVFRMSPKGVSELARLPTSPSSDLYPAKPDALAVGPGGALAILRTPSGSEPASRDSPALLFVLPGAASSASASASASALQPVILAPWSRLTSAADPACLGDTAGFRAIVQTKAPWVRLRGSPHIRDVKRRAMSARVRWSTDRVCLEAIELPDALFVAPRSILEPYIVARFTEPQAAGRVGVGLGSEMRQGLTCSLGATEHP